MDKFSRMNVYVNFSRGFIFVNKARLKNKMFCQIILDFIVTNMPMQNKSKVTKIAIFDQLFRVLGQNGGNICSRNNSEAGNSNDVIVGTIDNTESEEKVYEPRQKKKKVTEKNVVVKNNILAKNNILVFLKKENSC